LGEYCGLRHDVDGIPEDHAKGHLQERIAVELGIAVFLILLGLFGTIANTMIGGGGGAIFIPVLVLLFDLSPSNAIATSFVAVTIGAVVSTFAYLRQGMVDYRAGLVLGLLTLPGVFLGAFMTDLVPAKVFNSILGFAIIFFVVFVWFKRPIQTATIARANAGAKKDSDYVVNRRVAYPFAILTGFFAGTFGAGGGLIVTPAMVLAGFPIHVAVATSRLVILILSIGASLTRASLGQLELGYTLWLSAGSICGAFLGARVVRFMSSRTLTRLVTLLIIALGVALVIDSLL
jgi:hypothetical protein